MALLLSRWLLTLLGTAVLAGLVWLFGPLLPPLEPWLPRVLVIQSMLVVWALANALTDWRRRARTAALASGLSGDAADAEAAAVGRTLAEAMRQLQRSGQRGTLFEQPWYAIIGPPGAGKTTALLNAGLTLTLKEAMGHAAVAGVGGTRLCEWWFTKDAVLIDTAGRYTTQDSDAAVDRAGWEAFLDLLRRTRPGQPLNGIIVAIALPEIALAADAERAQHAAIIEQRIGELQQRLGVHLPIYALFTKADLIAGFSEFFDGMDREQRDQVWGTTFAWAATTVADTVERFTSGFRSLVERLNERLIQRLQAEHRLERRGLIAGFPTQVASLERPLADFIRAAFGGPAVAVGHATLLRGVYFASGTQEGTPIDRLTGAMARAFGIDQARAAALRPEQGRSYFLGSLLRDVVFGEAMLVREAPGARRQRRLLRLAGFAAVLLAVLAAGAVILGSRRGAEQQIDAVAAAQAGYAQAARGTPLDPVADGDLRPIVGLLDRAAALPANLPRQAVGLGMSQAEKLGSGINLVYRNGLTYGLLPRLVWRLETQMRGSLNRPDQLYEVTRLYLMLGGAGPLNVDQVREWMAQDWVQAYPSSEDAGLRAALARHLQNLLAVPLPAIALDGALVAQARASFSRVPLAERVYARIRLAAEASALPPWRPIDVLGPVGAALFVRASGRPMTEGIAAFYTAAGFRKLLLPALPTATQQVASETWVLGRRAELAPAELRDLQTAVTAAYLADFARRWDAMLADLNIETMTTLPQAAQDLYIMTSPDSPLRTLLKSLADQLALGSVMPALHYKPLIDLATGDGAALARSLRLLADIQQQLAKLAQMPVGTALPPGGEDLGAPLLADAARQPQPLARWLAAMSAAAQALRTGNARQQAAIAYNAPGGPAQACRAATAGFYPFLPDGPPLLIDDFARLFAPGGLIDGFFNTQMKPYVDGSAKVWKPQAAAGGPVAAGDVIQFQRAAAIRDAFFSIGQATPMVQFEIAPAASTPDGVTLDIAGTRIASLHGAAQAAQVIWPSGADAAATASLSADPPASGPPLLDSGPWALFKLFARGKFQPSGKPGRQILTFTLGGRPVAYEIRLAAPVNPFMPGLLTGFKCPAVQ